ncbi:MAG: PAS domain-containing protein [Gemmatirosa sp.]|nr:PAS domain-containing protein [Gemmatirosa sp.]
MAAASARLPDDAHPRDEDDRFEAVSRAAPVGIFHADLAGNVTYANPRLQAIWGLDEAAMLGRGWVARVHPADREPLLAGWTTANAEGRDYEHQFRLVLPDHGVRWVHGRSTFVRGIDGAVRYTVGTVDDVTVEREAAERTRGLLAISAALGRALTATDVADAVALHALPVVGSASCLVALLAADGKALERVGEGGLPPDERQTWDRMPIDDPVPITEVLQTGVPIFLSSPAEMARRYPEVAPVWGRMGARALAVYPLEVDERRFGAIALRFPEPQAFRDDDLAFLGAVVQQCAVSLERARLFDAARAAREEADEASRAKGEFLARMSHELRTPLNAIAGHLQLVEMGLHGPVTTAQQEALTRVGRAQRYLLGLINDVLNLARLESGRVDFALRPLLVAQAMADVEPMVQPQLAAKRLGFTVLLPEDAGDEPILVWADGDKLVQVLLNLLANAVKFTPEGGRVTIELRAAAESDEIAEILVRDTGIGIPSDRLGAVFEPFVQVHATLTRQYQGSGLGLAISRDLARGMGGDLTAESTLGAGSTFTLRLRRATTAGGEETDRRHRDTRRRGVERRSGDDRRHV